MKIIRGTTELEIPERGVNEPWSPGREGLIDALRSIVSYNCLAPRLQAIKKWPDNHPTYPDIICLFRDDSTTDDDQFEVFWMILVCMFGDWGTSPRWAWIDDVDGAYKFIDLLCDTSVEDDDDDE